MYEANLANARSVTICDSGVALVRAPLRTFLHTAADLAGCMFQRGTRMPAAPK
jgi:hypothetical protein